MRDFRSKKKVVIGIQARSTSQRFPRKVHALIGGVPVLDLIMDAASKSADQFNENPKSNVAVEFYLLVPGGDEIVNIYDKNFVIEGSEKNVLSRYKTLAYSTNADYIVRITADCPLLPSPVVTNVIKVGTMNGYDYLANFFEADGKLYRLIPDGFECEFFSRKMLDWALENANTDSHKEHVTTVMRAYNQNFSFGVIIPHVPYTDKKLSLDTVEEQLEIDAIKKRVDAAVKRAKEMFGKNCVHRY